MSKFVALIAAGMALAVCCGARADDAPPGTQERVGYALSLAGNAYHGDKSALATLRTNAAANDAGAEFGLGEYFVLTRDYAQSVAWFRKSADQGFAGGYLGLGVAHESGLGVPKDYAQAMRLYLKATELPEAQLDIGLLYARGRGVRQDDAQAASWYTKAANAGSVDADLALGSMYRMGSGAKQDDTQAMRWYRKAADLDNALGQYNVGLVYESSQSLQDYKQSAHWYQKAAEQGVAEAQLNLGMLYSSGKGVATDAARALQLFQMAANQGNGHAQYELADRFATGTGIQPDPTRAYQWMSIAKSSLDRKDPAWSMASNKLKDLERQLGPAQTARAKEAAAEWLQSHGGGHKGMQDRAAG